MMCFVNIMMLFLSGGLEMFDINPSTGWLYVKSTVRREDERILQQNGVVEIIVEASLLL